MSSSGVLFRNSDVKMNRTFDNIYFIDSEMSEQVRQNLMCIFLENLTSHAFIELNWDVLIQQWRLGISETILENTKQIFDPQGLEKIIRLELDLQLLEFQIDDLKERDKLSLCRMWYPEALGDLAFQDVSNRETVLLPLSLIHGVTLLSLFNRQLIDGKKLLSDEMLDCYTIEIDSYKSLSGLFGVPLSEMQIVSSDEQSREALEMLGLKKNSLYHQFLNKRNVLHHTFVKTA